MKEHVEDQPPNDADIVTALQKHSVGGKKDEKLSLLIDVKKNLDNGSIQQIFRGAQQEPLYLDLVSVFGDRTVAQLSSRNSKTAPKVEWVARALVEINNIYNKFDRNLNGRLVKASTDKMRMEKISSLIQEGATDASETRYKDIKEYVHDPNQSERQRAALRDGRLLVDETLRVCLLCKHPSMEEPLSNDENAKMNTQKAQEYAKEKAEHAALAGKNQASRRAPNKPKPIDTIARCACHLFGCNINGGTTCPACQDAIDEEKWSFSNGKCSIVGEDCEMCACNCALYLKVGLFVFSFSN